MFLELFVMVTHDANEWVADPGTCYVGRWYDSPFTFSSSNGGLYASQYADPSAPALPDVYTMPGESLCPYLFGSEYRMAGYSDSTAIGCTDAARPLQVCSDLGIDPYSIPQATTEEEATDPAGTTILCLDEPLIQSAGGGSPIGKPTPKTRTATSGFTDPPGNLPYSDCSQYESSGATYGHMLVSLDRRTACFDAFNTIHEVQIKTVGSFSYLEIGWATYAFNYSLTIDPTTKYNFAMTAQIRLVFESPFWDAVGHDMTFYPCEIYCTDSDSNWVPTGGTTWGGTMTAHFNATTPAAGTSDSVPQGDAAVVMNASSARVGHYQASLPMAAWRCDGAGMSQGSRLARVCFLGRQVSWPTRRPSLRTSQITSHRRNCQVFLVLWAARPTCTVSGTPQPSPRTGTWPAQQVSRDQR